MTHLFRELRRREARGEPVRTAVIGAGFMGKGLVYQLSKMPGMRPSLVVNRSVEKGIAAYVESGFRREQILVSDDPKALAVAVMEKRPAVTAESEIAGKIATLDVVIEATGRPEAVKQALDMVREGGRVIVCGHYTDNGPVTIHPHWQLNRKHVNIKGCWGSRYDHFHRAVALTAKYGNLKPWREMVSGRYDLEHADEALAAVESQTAIKALITPNPKLVESV